MPSNKFFLATILTLTSCVSLANSGASQNLSAASKHSVLSVTHGIKASGQVVSGVVAVPLLVVGQVGSASLATGEALMDHAVASEPLTVTEMTITADPTPAKTMQKALPKKDEEK
jgi:uncharacterized membrane protein